MTKPILTIGVLLVTFGTEIGAQTQVLVTNVAPAPYVFDSGRDFLVDLDAPAVLGVLDSSIDGAYPRPGAKHVITADGRFLLAPYQRADTQPPGMNLPSTWTHGIGFRDLVTSTTGFVPTNSSVGTGQGVGVMVAHPSEPIVYFSDLTGGLGILDASGVRTIAPCGQTKTTGLAMAPNGAEVYAACGLELVALDPRSGSELRRLALPYPLREIHVLPASRLFALSDDAGAEISIFNLVTGARMASAPSPVANHRVNWAVPRPDGSSVLLGVSTFETTLGQGVAESWPFVLDSQTLIALGQWPFDDVVRAAFTSDSRRVVLLRRVLLSGVTGLDLTLRGVVYDVSTGGVIADAPLGSDGTGDASSVVMREPPPAPDSLTAAVSGSQVTLSWTMPATSRAATEFVVEAGFSPAAIELVRISTGNSNTTAVVEGVPPGVYYVRVRGTNAAGVGTPSVVIEVQVD